MAHRYSTPICATLFFLATVCANVISLAAEPLPAEKLVTLPRIPSNGPLVYATDTRRVMLIDASTLEYQATLGLPGWSGQFLLPKSKDVAYLTLSWWDYFNEGTRRDFVEIWNVSTARRTGARIEVPPRIALTELNRSVTGLSADEKFLFLQNATPATSVSVVDMAANKFVAEIPLPGCFGIYPDGTTPNQFMSLCGDGKMITVRVDAKGKNPKIERSGMIFNAEEDPLFTSSVRDGDVFWFVSFHGSIYEVNGSGPSATLVNKYSIVDGVEGRWAPTGEQPLAYASDDKILFVLMFPDAKDGDQNNFGREVWAIDAKNKRVLSRSTISNASGIAYAPSPTPALFMNYEESALVRYAVDPKAGYSARMDKRFVVKLGPRLEVR